MANNTRVTRKDAEVESDWLENELIAVYRNLLERPQNRRGPFVIEDRDLSVESNRSTKSKSAA